MEERLTLTESRVSGMIAAQRTAALQQQKSQHPDVSSSTTAPVAATSVERTEVVNASNDVKVSATNTVPGTADLRTIQLRVMCRQRGLDANGTEAELLKRLNDAVAAAQYAQQQSSSSSSSSAAPTAGTQKEEGYLSQSSIHQSRHVANDSLEESAGSGDDDQDYDDEEEEEKEEEEEYTGYAEEVEEEGEESYEEEAQFFEEKGVEEVGNYDSDEEEEGEEDEGSDEEVDK